MLHELEYLLCPRHTHTYIVHNAKLAHMDLHIFLTLSKLWNQSESVDGHPDGPG